MRKMKKINGYLVVKFNDREKREYEGTALGEYGVIDAELYTGSLDIDRGAMEYDNAGTIEEAVELARGLESELDVEEPAVTITIVKETDESTSEQGPIEPQLMIAGWERVLANQIKSPHYRDVDERTATHELYGFKVALKELGILPEEDCFVRPDVFGAYDIPNPLPREPEELLAYFCDEKCRERIPGRAQEELEAACAKCGVEQLATQADDRDLRVRLTAHGELNAFIDQMKTAETPAEGAAAEREARAYLRALVATRAVTERERSIFETAIRDAARDRLNAAERATFEHLNPGIKRDRTTARVYALGLVLARDCPDNDCRVYLNIFNMARELDAALDGLDEDGAPALALRRELRERVSELAEMYRENHAVQKYKEAMQP